MTLCGSRAPSPRLTRGGGRFVPAIGSLDVAHTFEDLVTMQRAADEAHTRVERLRDEYGPPTQGDGWTEQQTETYDSAWRDWRRAAASVQAAVTEHAREQGTARNAVEAEVKAGARHPESVGA